MTEQNLTTGADETDDVLGHTRARSIADINETEDDVEGHARRGIDEADDDVEGHMRH
jgi:hypothetical protein